MKQAKSQIFDSVLLLFLDKAEELKNEIIAIYLFGSRVRETFRPDSDYDLLVVTKDKSIKEKLYDIAVDIFCETGADISLKIFTKENFDRLKSLRTPFVDNVLMEGRKIA